MNDFEVHCEVSVNGAGARSIARLKRPGYQKSFSALCAQSCALLITVEEILSGPAVALFVVVSLSKSLSGKSIDLKFLHTLAAKLEYRI